MCPLQYFFIVYISNLSPISLIMIVIMSYNDTEYLFVQIHKCIRDICKILIHSNQIIYTISNIMKKLHIHMIE